MNKKETRGGARPGAGRKPAPNKKIRIGTSLAPDVVEILRSNDEPTAQMIETAIRAVYGPYGKEIVIREGEKCRSGRFIENK